jgi:hypothetical protein
MFDGRGVEMWFDDEGRGGDGAVPEYREDTHYMRVRAAMSEEYEVRRHALYAHTASAALSGGNLTVFRALLTEACASMDVALSLNRAALVVAKSRNTSEYELARQQYAKIIAMHEGEASPADAGPAPPLGFVDVLPGAVDQEEKIDLHVRERARLQFERALKAPKALKIQKTRDDADRIAAGLLEYAPWMTDVIEILWTDMLSCVDAGDGLFIRPLLIVGPPGCGKTVLFMRLAELVGMPHARLEMAGATAVFDVTGAESTWATATPGEPVAMIHRSGSASGLVILDEIEKGSRPTSSGGDPLQGLLPLLNRATARTFRSPFLGRVVDLSHLSFVATANSLDGIPGPLRDRLRVVEVGMPTGAHLESLVRRQVGEEPAIVSRLASEIEAGRLSLRGLERIAENIRRIKASPAIH